MSNEIREFGYHGNYDLSVFGDDASIIEQFINEEGRDNFFNYELDKTNDIKSFFGSHRLLKKVMAVYRLLKENDFELLSYSFSEYVLYDYSLSGRRFPTYSKLLLSDRTRIKRITDIFYRWLINKSDKNYNIKLCIKSILIKNTILFFACLEMPFLLFCRIL